MQKIQFMGKQVSLTDFLPIRKNLKNDGKKLVWTNGCFDLLHEGHVAYLQNARNLGDVLLVAINSDKSFNLWKNRKGPIHTQFQRSNVLLALRCVDYIIFFDKSSPLKLLKEIQPDIYVKGDDYTIETIDQNERAVVENCGGKIEFCSGVPGMSTSNIIRKILNLYKDDGEL
jgi:rfaE bifunctional protein nucleotidyltransferase chain/domain